MATSNPFDIKTNNAPDVPQVQAGQVGTPAQSQAFQASTTDAQAGQAGLINAAQAGQAQTTNAAAGQAGTERAAISQANAQQVAMDPTKQTVQGQLDAILRSGSPLLVQAQTRAAQAANARGLINSSMAVGAGESALYDVAAPIAQQDASTYQQSALANADMAQQTELANVGARNQGAQFNAAESNTTGRFNTSEQNVANRQNAAESNTTSRFNTEQSNVTARQNAAEANTTSRFNTGEGNTTARQNASEANTTGRFNAETQSRASEANAARQQEALITNAQLGQQASTTNAENATRMALQQMDATTRENLVNIEANYRTLMQASQSAGEMYQQALRTITDITMNKDLDAAAKNAAIDSQLNLLRNGMNLVGAMNNLGLDELLSFDNNDITAPVPNAPPPPASAPAVPDFTDGINQFD